jgi:isochorismate hydrolase
MWRDSINLDSELSQINNRISTHDGLIIDKTEYSAFYETELDSHLRNDNIEQVVITGVHSHLCCESTARDAFFRGFEVFFAVDATATYSEHLHLGTLRAITHGFGVCVSSEEILNA